MRLSISNLAWDPLEDGGVADMLGRYGVDAIDVAPGKYFPDPAAASASDIARVRGWWADRGIEIVGLQALLFGTQGLNLFGTPDIQERMLRHLDCVCRIGQILGATRLVFGAPRNRDRTGLSDVEATASAKGFFGKLGELAESRGVMICLEPNPVSYGANFMTTSLETARIVMETDHPAIRMQLDTGSMASNGENPEEILSRVGPLIGHVHASEPGLVPLGEGETRHEQMAAALRRYLPQHVVTIEMLTPATDARLTAIERSLLVAKRYYQSCNTEIAL